MTRSLSILGAIALTPLFSSALQANDGSAIYQRTCQACHQNQGQGIPGTFPPLANSEWVSGPAENLIRIQLRGLSGEITVNGVKYPGTIAMEPNATLSDEEIASVLTYVRSNFGNKADAVTPDMVKALRGEEGKPKLTVADLKDPHAVKVTPETTDGATTDASEAAEPTPQKAADISTDTGSNATIIGLVIGWIALCTLPVLFGGKK